MPEKEQLFPDDMHMGDGELEELFVAEGECAEAGRVLERIGDLSFDDEDSQN